MKHCNLSVNQVHTSQLIRSYLTNNEKPQLMVFAETSLDAHTVQGLALCLGMLLIF